MTPDELDALPTDSLIRVDGEVYERVEPDYVVHDKTWRCLHEYDERRGFVRYSARDVLNQGRLTMLALPNAADETVDEAAEWEEEKPSRFAAAFNAYADEHASPCHQPRPSITPGLARLLLGFLADVEAVTEQEKTRGGSLWRRSVTCGPWREIQS